MIVQHTTIRELVHKQRVTRLALFPVGAISWSLLFASLELGRTTPTTISRVWLATLLASGIALLAWHSLFVTLFYRVSRLPMSESIAKASTATIALLLSLPFLVAIYQSDVAFHFFFMNPIPKAMVSWTPLLAMLAHEEASLVWNAKLDGGVAKWLHKRFSIQILLFATFACLYVFSAGGHLYTPDETGMYQATEKFAEMVPITALNGGGKPHDDGTQPGYSKYGLVPSFLGIPPYWLSKLVGPEPDPPSAAFPIPNGAYPLVDLLVNPLITAATCAILFGLARLLGLGPFPSLAVVLLYGLTTSAWVYAKTFISQPPTTFFLLSAVYLLLGPKPSVPAYALAGLSLGLAVGSRAEVLLLAAPLVIPILHTIRRAPTLALKTLTVFVVIFVGLVAVTLGWYDWLKTGSIFATGHGSQGTLAGFFAPKPYIGLMGTLISPGFGVLLYNPTVLLGWLSLPLLGRSRPREMVFIVAMLALALAFYGSFSDWIGGFTWGNRYLVVTLPLALIPIGALLQEYWGKLSTRLVVTGTAIVSFCITFLAVVFDWNSGWLDLWGHHARQHLITWDPHYSPILAHLRLLHDFFYTGAKLDLYIYYKLGVPSLLFFLLLFVALLTLTVRTVSESQGGRKPQRSAA